MPWVVVPNLDEARDQLNARFPDRDKASDGAIGDTRHQAGASSHNPDRTGSPEHRDGDSKDEVRARDFDKDLRDPDGVTMEQVVQLWVKLARSGVLWWVRYIIYNRRIWHRRDGFKTHTYTGSNPHDKHCHLNSDFTQQADETTGTNWHLNELGKPTKPAPKPTPKPTGPLGDRLLRLGAKGSDVVELQKLLNVRGAKLATDGIFGPKTDAAVRAFQRSHWLAVDGIVGPDTLGALRTNLGSRILKRGMKGSDVGELQRLLNRRGAKLAVDHDFGPKTDAAVRAFQRSRRLAVDGLAGPKTVAALRG